MKGYLEKQTNRVVTNHTKDKQKQQIVSQVKEQLAGQEQTLSQLQGQSRCQQLENERLVREKEYYLAQIADLKSELVGMEQSANAVVYTNQTVSQASPEGVGEGNYTDYEHPEAPMTNAKADLYAYERVPDHSSHLPSPHSRT